MNLETSAYDGVAAREASTIDQLLAMTDARIDEVTSAWERLRHRIDLIVQPELPNATAVDPNAADVPPPSSKLASKLRDHHARLETLATTINATTNRLDS